MRLEYDAYQKKILSSLFREISLLFIILAVIEMVLFSLTNYADALTRIFFLSYICLLYFIFRKWQIGVDLSPFSNISSRFFSKRSVRITKITLIIITLIWTLLVFSQIRQGNYEAFMINNQLAAFRSRTNFTTPMLSFLLWLHINVNTRIQTYDS